MADPKQLKRLHRVRTLQLNLVRADEARARDRLAQELALHNRIAQLARGVAPAPSASAAVEFLAAAHFRERLQHSAHAAEQRVAGAQAAASRAADATREARRDQTAMEKLLARSDAEAALKALRALEAAPVFRKVRHDPC